MTSTLSSPSGRAAESAGARVPVRLAIADPELAARVRRDLALSPGLVETDLGAALVLTDQIDGVSETHWTEDQPRLSHREQQVAGLLLEGASNKLIARRLDISVHTAKFHVTRILDKLGAQNRADAVSIILRDGLVTL